MKLATYRIGKQMAVGVVHGEDRRLFELIAAENRSGSASGWFSSMLDLIDVGESALERARRLFETGKDDPSLSISLDDAEVQAPLPEPRQMRDAMSFPLHILQAPRGQRRLAAQARGDFAEAERIAAEPLGDLPEVYRRHPIYYFTNRLSVQGTGTTVRWPTYSTVMDYEVEFGIVTKGRGSNISVEKAREHIFGYTLYNDFSARDMQRSEMEGRLGPAKGKSFDGGNVIGPWIVTVDEIANPYDMTFEARVNGELRSRSSSNGMLFSFEELIAYISRDETVVAGEFIGSGTVGNGCGLETGSFLNHGDTIEIEVGEIRILRNIVERGT